MYTKQTQTNYRWIESSAFKCPNTQCLIALALDQISKIVWDEKILILQIVQLWVAMPAELTQKVFIFSVFNNWQKKSSMRFVYLMMVGMYFILNKQQHAVKRLLQAINMDYYWFPGVIFSRLLRWFSPWRYRPFDNCAKLSKCLRVSSCIYFPCLVSFNFVQVFMEFCSIFN